MAILKLVGLYAFFIYFLSEMALLASSSVTLIDLLWRDMRSNIESFSEKSHLWSINSFALILV